MSSTSGLTAAVIVLSLLLVGVILAALALLYFQRRKYKRVLFYRNQQNNPESPNIPPPPQAAQANPAHEDPLLHQQAQDHQRHFRQHHSAVAQRQQEDSSEYCETRNNNNSRDPNRFARPDSSPFKEDNFGPEGPSANVASPYQVLTAGTSFQEQDKYGRVNEELKMSLKQKEKSNNGSSAGPMPPIIARSRGEELPSLSENKPRRAPPPVPTSVPDANLISSSSRQDNNGIALRDRSGSLDSTSSVSSSSSSDSSRNEETNKFRFKPKSNANPEQDLMKSFKQTENGEIKRPMSPIMVLPPPPLKTMIQPSQEGQRPPIPPKPTGLSIEKKDSKGSISTQPQLVQKDDRDTISSFSRTGSSSSSSSGASLKNVTSSLGKVLKEEIANKTELDSTPSKEEKPLEKKDCKSVLNRPRQDNHDADSSFSKTGSSSSSSVSPLNNATSSSTSQVLHEQLAKKTKSDSVSSDEEEKDQENGAKFALSRSASSSSSSSGASLTNITSSIGSVLKEEIKKKKSEAGDTVPIIKEEQQDENLTQIQGEKSKIAELPHHREEAQINLETSSSSARSPSEGGAATESSLKDSSLDPASNNLEEGRSSAKADGADSSSVTSSADSDSGSSSSTSSSSSAEEHSDGDTVII